MKDKTHTIDEKMHPSEQKKRTVHEKNHPSETGHSKMVPTPVRYFCTLLNFFLCIRVKFLLLHPSELFCTLHPAPELTFFLHPSELFHMWGDMGVPNMAVKGKVS